MDRLRAMEVFVEIVDRGGLARAAGALRMSPAMVTTHLARLEERLGTRLLDRSTRRMELTREGRRFLEDARRILGAVQAAEDVAQGRQAGPRGRVTIDAPASVGHRYLLPAIPAFHRACPDVVVNLSFGDRGTLFRPDGFDVLLRIGEQQPDHADVRALGATRFVYVAAPDYLARRGTPTSPEEIERHDCIVYISPEQPGGHRWNLSDGDRTQWLRPPAVFGFNDGDAIAAAAVAGLGIAGTLEMLVADELADGRLVTLFEDFVGPTLPILAFAPLDRSSLPAVAATLDFLEGIDWPRNGEADFSVRRADNPVSGSPRPKS